MRIINGFLLAIQFFTTIPFQKNIQWDSKSGRWCVRFIPLIGLILGVLLASIHTLFLNYFPISNAMIALFLMFFSVLFSGGLHVDGWMDCSDAFFSYKDKDRRLEIMSDARVGAFAVISLLFLFGFRYLFIFESMGSSIITIALLVIPILSRTFMVYLLVTTPLAKHEGMAAAFKKHLTSADKYFVYATVILVLVLLYFFTHLTSLLFTVILMLASFFLFFRGRAFIVKHFGGMTGDTLGAFVEGTETVLWLICWLYASYYIL
ncbi:adenosylcobinamide-GDP ribazoletransferase [Bacillus sp. SM2101]|uniref:adenosylcobinamide-GDP ribazoletransferase n=1 Tax=Bacillus sp. SM2101 TaxID=2805366 RepID=UPI001BDE3782|nr:adenosylcobinamide-GDP ribazoletransferase [Bacillus sp. SM2101]